MHRIERTYDATAEQVWELWTTAEGIEAWWAPDGFEVEVDTFDPRPGGELVYTMTATGPEQVRFMDEAGLPLSTQSRKTFTELEWPKRIAYRSLIDFVPGVEPYDHLTVVDLENASDGLRVVMTVEPLHAEEWTQRLLAGRGNELDNLGRLLAEREKGVRHRNGV